MRISLAFVLVTLAVTAYALPKPGSSEPTELELKDQKPKTGAEDPIITKLNNLQAPTKPSSQSFSTNSGSSSQNDPFKTTLASNTKSSPSTINQSTNPTSLFGQTSNKSGFSFPQNSFAQATTQSKETKLNDPTKTQSNTNKNPFEFDKSKSPAPLTNSLNKGSNKFQVEKLDLSAPIPSPGSKKLKVDFTKKLDLNQITPQQIQSKKVDPVFEICLVLVFTVKA
ncbi:hypothetical protein CROQUDRAFT_397481 [Cronartium quercuum f. sp. fusiforme G11]|uniref:Uncharacterized protein n=1 Tax=Cronartium quercuum f. sp. fusiforme G11 TaxID=708437 RepID=A0A9P6TE56_9BASI|nr:hypothetical protein CROQUDRAFT_397481 [Cronartium quercuum f. sp. fusiforme G11]